MRLTAFIVYVFCLVAATALPAWACRDDFDCSTGSRCRKESPGDWEGVCVGGFRPGNRNDRRPPTDTLRDSSYGEICLDDSRCGWGMKCYRERAADDGVCVPR